VGRLAVMGPEGDTKLIWDSDNEDEVANARRTFDDLRCKNYTAYSVKKSGKKGKVITEFDPDAEKIILVPHVIGG
jgi:hypothetical protein